MARRSSRLLLALTAIALLALPPVAALFAAGTPKMARPYPATFAPGPGHDLAEQRCLMCHNATLVTQQAKDSAGWARTIGSTLLGQGVDTSIFLLVAFAGVRSVTCGGRGSPRSPWWLGRR